MTSPLSPEAVAQMVADREAGTPGPWHFDGPVWNQIIWMDGENRLCFMAHSNGLNDDRDIANARRIARLPDIEAAYLTLAAENATLRAEIDIWTAEIVSWKMVVEAVERDVDREYKRAETAETELATLRASAAAALERVKVLEKALANPIAVHANMLRGTIAMPSFANIKHLYAAEFAALTPTADKEPKT